MLRQDLLIRKDQKDFLQSLSGNLSDHIRRAIDDYITKKKQELMSVSLSPSKRGGVQNG